MTVSKYLSVIFILSCAQLQSWAQAKENWVLPKHQIQVQGGMSNNTDYLGFINSFANCPYVGATYYYNFLHKWYASLDYQYIQGTFKMGLTSYKNIDNTTFETIRTYPSPENPMSLPLVRMTQNRSTKDTDIKKSEYVKVVSPDGLYKRNHYNLNGGYMRVTPRNILRIGLGITYFRLQSRDILTNVEESKTNSVIANIPHLRYLDKKGWEFNTRIAYDFFITQKLSIGLQLSSISTINIFQGTARQAGLTVGYAPFALNKKSVKPRV